MTNRRRVLHRARTDAEQLPHFRIGTAFEHGGGGKTLWVNLPGGFRVSAPTLFPSHTRLRLPLLRLRRVEGMNLDAERSQLADRQVATLDIQGDHEGERRIARFTNRRSVQDVPETDRVLP